MLGKGPESDPRGAGAGQVPVLFTGTMRENLDPFRAHTDAQVWAALRRAHLAPLVEANPQVSDGFDNSMFHPLPGDIFPQHLNQDT